MKSMLTNKHEEIIQATRNYLYKKYGAAFFQLNEEKQNDLICDTIRRILQEKKPRN